MGKIRCITTLVGGPWLECATWEIKGLSALLFPRPPDASVLLEGGSRAVGSGGGNERGVFFWGLHLVELLTGTHQVAT